MILIYVLIAIFGGIFLQKLLAEPKPPDYTYLGNSTEAYNNAQAREEASSKKTALFVSLFFIGMFFVYCIADYKPEKSAEKPISLEEKTEALNQELKRNAKIQELENSNQSKELIQNQIVPIVEPKQIKTKERLNSAGNHVDKNGYLE